MDRKWGTLISCCLSCFMAWLDYYIVNIALPAIETDLSATLSQLQWVVNAYTVSLIALIVTMGRLSDWIGRKNLHLASIGAFGIFSYFCGSSTSPNELIFWRLMQGIAAAALIPTALALISHAFPGKEKGKAIGIWSGITGIAMAVGPMIGGFLVSALNWSWIFYINIPLSAISILVTALFASETYRGGSAQKIDPKGFCLLTLGLVALLFSLMEAPDLGWLSGKSIGLYAATVLFLGWFYKAEQTSASPIIPFAIFNNCSFFCGTIVLFCLIFSMSASMFLIPLYLMQVRHIDPYVAGMIILPLTVAIAIISPFAGKLMGRFKAKELMLAGMAFYCLSTIFQAFIGESTSLSYLLISYVLLGVGWGISRPPATTTAIASASHQFAGTATGVLWSVQNIGGALGIALTVTIFRKIYETASDATSFLAGYHTSMWILSAFSFACIAVLVFYLRPKRVA